MFKLLIINLSGDQEIILVGKGGAYFDISKVVWDERIDGPLPDEAQNFLGGISKVNNQLVYDKAAAAAQAKKIADAAAAVIAAAQQEIVLQQQRDAELDKLNAAVDIASLKTVVQNLIAEVKELRSKI